MNDQWRKQASLVVGYVLAAQHREEPLREWQVDRWVAEIAVALRSVAKEQDKEIADLQTKLAEANGLRAKAEHMAEAGELAGLCPKCKWTGQDWIEQTAKERLE